MPFKDLPEGQTHFENDGCGIPEHNSKSFSERFDERFCNGLFSHGNRDEYDSVKQFFLDEMKVITDRIGNLYVRNSMDEEIKRKAQAIIKSRLNQ